MIAVIRNFSIKHRTHFYLYISKFLSQKQYWNTVGKIAPLDAILDNYFDEKEFFKTGKDTLAFFQKQKLISKKSTTLHIGSGIGRIEKHLAKYVNECYGVDVSEVMIEKANTHKTAKNATFIATNGKTLPFKNDYFDFIYSVLVFQHMPKSMFLENIKEVKRTLKPKGKFFFQIPIDDAGEKKFPAESNPWLMRYYKRKEILKIVNRFGFSIEKTFNGYEKDTKSPLQPNFAVLCSFKKKSN